MRVNSRSITKRVAALSVVAIGALSLAACDGDGADVPTPSASVEPSGSSDEELAQAIESSLSLYLDALVSVGSGAAEATVLEDFATPEQAQVASDEVEQVASDGVIVSGSVVATFSALEVVDRDQGDASAKFCIDRRGISLSNNGTPQPSSAQNTPRLSRVDFSYDPSRDRWLVAGIHPEADNTGAGC